MNLVVGATGALGGMIARDLIGLGESVRVLVRPGSAYGALVEAGAQPVMGDLRDAASLERACAGVRTVITTANSAARGGADTVDSVDRQGNRALVSAAAAAGVEHFIFVSALGADASSPVEFLRAKAEAEAHVQASGVTWTILRPNIFMDVWIPTLIGLPLAENRPVLLVRPASHRHALVAARDVCAFAVAAIHNDAARNAIVTVAGPEAVTWTQVAELAGAALGRSIEIQQIAPGDALPGLPPVVSQLAAAFETYETVIDMNATAAQFGVQLTRVQTFLEEQFARPLDV